MTTNDPVTTEEYQIPFIVIIPFLLITFIIAWGILGLYIFLPAQMEASCGAISGAHPLFFLAVYAPAIAACIVILRVRGLTGLGRFLRRVFLWRVSIAWYAFLCIGVPLIFYIGAALRGTLFSDPFPFTSAGALITALGLAAIKGPVEEVGWRGVALPILQRRFAPFWSGIILGVIWGLWHLPAFLLSGTQQSGWAFTPFFIGCIALSMIVTALFNASGGSILLSAFFHFMLMNPVFPAAEPYDTYLFVGVALCIVWWNRKGMFHRSSAVTRVIPRDTIPET